MTYDFDKIIDRTGSGDLKHGVLLERYGRSDLLPLWVADATIHYRCPTSPARPLLIRIHDRP